MKKLFLFNVVILAATPNVAYAYLDPGTGSILLQLLAAGVVTASVAITSIRMKIRSFFERVFKKKETKSEIEKRETTGGKIDD